MTPHKLIQDLYVADSVMGECRICPRLTKNHVFLTPFQKMNVSKAVQVNIIFFIYKQQPTHLLLTITGYVFVDRYRIEIHENWKRNQSRHSKVIYFE